MNTPPKGDFCVRIDFDRSTPNPERVFIAMTDIIQAFRSIDHGFIQSIDSKIEPVLMLEDIEASSLKVWLRSVLEAVDDDALKSLDWKKQVGKYLVKGKYILLDFLNKRTEITDAKEIRAVQMKLLQAAEETHVNQFPVYTPISTSQLIDGINRLSKATNSLGENDKVEYLSEEGDASFNMTMEFSPENIEQLMTRETLSNTSRMILKVKRPDYLGTAQWDFKHDTRTIQAKIEDDGWLGRFQSRLVDVRPGDSVRADVRIDVRYGHDMAVIGTHYAITNVVEIIRDYEDGAQRTIDGL